MTSHNSGLSERLKKLGFAQKSKMKLYGEEYQLVSDPIITSEEMVFIEVIDNKSQQPRRVRIPLPIVHMANSQRTAA
jgi:hypothetical protein